MKHLNQYLSFQGWVENTVKWALRSLWIVSASMELFVGYSKGRQMYN